MARGPLGGPRPLATGSVAILITVEESTKNDNALSRPHIIEAGLRNGGVEIKEVALDPRANTYLFNTGLDVLEWDNLRELRDEYEKIVEHHNMIQVGESQVGFQ